MSPIGTPLKIIWGGVVDDGGIKFILNDTLSKHAIGDIVYKPVNKTAEHEYLLPLDGQELDTTKYKRLVDYLGTSTLPDLNGRYLRADSNPNVMIDAGLPNITGKFKVCGTDFGGLDTLDGAFHAILRSQGGGAAAMSQDGYQYSSYANFDASYSNPIYGKSTTVTPLTYTVRAFICYA